MIVYLLKKKISPQTSVQNCKLTDTSLQRLFFILYVTLLGLYVQAVLSGHLTRTPGKANSKSSGAFLRTSGEDEQRAVICLFNVPRFK